MARRRWNADKDETQGIQFADAPELLKVSRGW